MEYGSNLLTGVFSGASETRQLEFKEGFNWQAQESAKLRDELIKAILAMSNTPGGGTIILGIRTDTKKKKVYLEGMSSKDAQSFLKDKEQIFTVVHVYCQRPVDFDIQSELHPEEKDKWFIIFQVSEFYKWPTVTVKSSKTLENNKKTRVIENHAVYTRSKLAQWSSVKAGPQEIEDIVEIAVKKYDAHVKSLGYTKVEPRDKEIKEWFDEHQAAAVEGIQHLGIKAFMEVKARFVEPDMDFRKVDLRDAARESTVHTFGWPIAVFLDNREEYRPVADDSGIKAVLSIEKDALEGRKTFDYWAIHTSGAFYTLKSLFEDYRDPEIISFNTRIVRITEVFMYLERLYSHLGIDPAKNFEVVFKHGGIKGRRLGTLSQGRIMIRRSFISVDGVKTKIVTSVKEFQKDPAGVVEKITEPLFEQFDFYKIDRKIVEEIVQSYLSGKVT